MDNLAASAPAVQARTVFDCQHLSSLVRIRKDDNSATVYPIRCKKWWCSYCCMMNEILLREKVLLGKPERMLTLTFRPDRNMLPRDTVKLVRPCVNRLYQQLRYHCGAWEAATFLELHKSGYPHWHALVRGNYITQSKISELWNNLTGSRIVDIRRIKDAQTALRYVSKYVTKNIVWVQRARLGRTVTFTRGYLPPDSHPPSDPSVQWYRDHRAPWEVIERSYNDFTAVWEGNVCRLTKPTC